MANREGCLLITSDKDFGEPVFRLQRITAGVILVRLAGIALDTKVEIVSRAIATHGKPLSSAFTVVSRSSIRIRQLL
jgi:predicted nuclease of predicted toxin-antitoxin system